MSETMQQELERFYRHEQNFRVVKTLDADARTLADFLHIAGIRGYCREWAETKYALRMAHRA